MSFIQEYQFTSASDPDHLDDVDSVGMRGKFNVTVNYTSGQSQGLVALQRSFDDKVWTNLTIIDMDATFVAEEPEAGVKYRLVCLEHAGGEGYIYGRISR